MKHSITLVFIFFMLIPISEVSAQSFLKRVGKAVDKWATTPATENKETNSTNTATTNTGAKSTQTIFAYSELNKIVRPPRITENTKIIEATNGSSRSDMPYTFTSFRDSIFWFSNTHGKSWIPFNRDGEIILGGYVHPFKEVPHFCNGVAILPSADVNVESCLVSKQGKIVKNLPLYRYTTFNNEGIAAGFIRKAKSGVAAVSSRDIESFAVLINTKGDIVFNPGKKLTDFYDGPQIRNFSDSLMAYCDYNSRLWGFLDMDFNVRVEAKYPTVHNFSEGLAAVKDAKGNWGFINTQGETVIPHKFSHEPSDFSEGYAVARKRDGYDPYVFINKKGEIVHEGMSAAKPFKNGYANVTQPQGHLGSSNCLLGKNFKVVHIFNDDQCAIKLGKNYYTNKGILSTIDGVDDPFYEGLAKFRYTEFNKVNWNGFVNEDGEIAILFKAPEF